MNIPGLGPTSQLMSLHSWHHCEALMHFELQKTAVMLPIVHLHLTPRDKFAYYY